MQLGRLLDAVSSNQWIYKTLKRAQPLYFDALARRAAVVRFAATRGPLSSVLRNPLTTGRVTDSTADGGSRARDGVTENLLHPSQSASRTFPPDTPLPARDVFAKVARARSGPAAVYQIAGGCLWGAGAAVITRDRVLLGDLSPVIRTAPDAHPIFYRPLVRRPIQVQGPVGVISGPSAGNLSHWMFGVLPRLSLLAQFDPHLKSVAKIAVPAATAPFQRECLVRYGVSADQILSTDSSTYLRSDEIWAPSFVSPAYVAPRWFLKDLRERFADVAPATDAPRLYISRRSARGRRVVNEDAVVRHLESEGFRSVQLEDLPFTQQVALFKGARIIVGPHGAGLTQLCFAAEGTGIIELFSPSYINPMYWALADELRLRHHACLGVRGGADRGNDLVRSDIRLHIPDLERAVRAVERSRTTG